MVLLLENWIRLDEEQRARRQLAADSMQQAAGSFFNYGLSTRHLII
jgi:hypothetical protein